MKIYSSIDDAYEDYVKYLRENGELRTDERGDNMKQKIIPTKYGNAKIDKKGHYSITSRKEGNNGKYLHRLIYADFYDIEIPKNYDIHHKDGNKLNNCIMNLQMVPHGIHTKNHQKGENNSLWNPKARVIKNGLTSYGKQKYALRYNGKNYIFSVNYNKLEKFSNQINENHLNEKQIIQLINQK